MIRVTSFSRGVGLAAGIALAWIPWCAISAPILGGSAAHALYFCAALTLCLALLGGRARRAVVAVSVPLGLAGVSLVDGLNEAALVLAVLLGVFRSGLLYGPASPRSIALEIVLIGGGLLFAGFMARPGLLGTAVGLWSFFLVQSFYFLRGDLPVVRRAVPQADRFETACRRADELLDRG